MIYNVRWKSVDDDQEFRSHDHPSVSLAMEFACALLGQMAVSEISVVDDGGQRVMMLPEITRYCRGNKPH
jgi:hypothetical protein